MSDTRHEARVRILESVLAAVLAGDRSDLCVSADELWEKVAGAVQGVDFGERMRFETRSLIQHSGTYLDLLAPDVSWTLEPSPDGRLMWKRGGEVFSDYFVPRTANTDPWARQDRAGAREAVREGRDRFEDGFLGVRLLFPIRPARSLWLTDVTQRPVPLAESSVWSPWHSPEELRAALVVREAS